MRAMLIVRADAMTKHGGDLVHARHAAKALAGANVDVELVATDQPDPRGFDVAHVFGIFEPERAARQIAAVRAAGVPLVLSPIWLDLRALFTVGREVDRALEAPTAAIVERRLARLQRHDPALAWQGKHARAADRRVAQQRALALAADVVLPASEVEAYLYGERLRLAGVPFVVAALGLDDDAFAVPRDRARRGVLMAGRIEPKKNQAAMLYALRDVDVDVTLVGAAYDDRYLALCKRWATPRTRFVPPVEHAEVARFMAEAAVHAHPSWLESPGLSSLEAAAAGARIVVGDRGCEREYFGPEAGYANPADPASIRDAVVRALALPPRRPDDALDRRLRSRTWKAHAEATLAAYSRAVTPAGAR